MEKLKLRKETVMVALGVLLILVGVVLSVTKKSEENYYSISFYVEEGNLLKEQKIEAGEKIEIEEPVKEGYIFDGWYVGEEKYDFNTKVDSDIKLVAKWTKVDGTENPGTDPSTEEPVIEDPVVEDPVVEDPVEEKTYTVTFDTDGGSKVANQKVGEGKTVTKPTATKDGYTLVGWYLNGKEYDFKTKVTADITLTAKWEEAYKVTFDTDGGNKVANQSVAQGSKATKPSNPTKEGYKFVEWQLNGQTYDFSKAVTSDIILKAKWEKVNTVTFNSIGGSKVASQSVEINKTATKPSNPTRSGYKFIEWQLNGQAYDFSKIVTGDITLVAKWEKVNTVTFDSNGGSKVASQSVETNKTATKPSNPTREGYTFLGWYLNNQEYNFETVVTKDITLVAKWEIKKFTVTFNTNGGTQIASQTVEYGKKATKPANPVKDGYIFTGWTVSGKTYDFSSVVKSNITVVANYREKQYTFKVGTIDQYSPDRTITVYEEGSQINFTSIKVNGVVLCSGSNPTVSYYDIEGVNTVTVVLTSGTEVTARIG